jgi:hypothetical protein
LQGENIIPQQRAETQKQGESIEKSNFLREMSLLVFLEENQYFTGTLIKPRIGGRLWPKL